MTICIFRESLVGLLGLASSVASALASIGERRPAARHGDHPEFRNSQKIG